MDILKELEEQNFTGDELPEEEIKAAKTSNFAAGSWTAIKLIALGYYTDMYSVAGSQMRRIYIDLFSGSGLTKIRETGDLIPGSPIVALKSARKPFEKVYLSDNDPAKIRQLEEIIEIVRNEFDIETEEGNIHINCMDCSKAIEMIINDLEKELEQVQKNRQKPFMFLAFIDPTGFLPKWKDLIRLLNYQGDLIINFQTFLIPRQIPQKTSGLMEFIGPFPGSKLLKEKGPFPQGRCLQIAEELRELYKKQLGVFGRSWVVRKKTEHITVGKGEGYGGGYFYDLIFAARETSGGSKWFDSVLPGLKQKLEKETGTTMRWALDIVSGRRVTLDRWM